MALFFFLMNSTNKSIIRFLISSKCLYFESILLVVLFLLQNKWKKDSLCAVFSGGGAVAMSGAGIIGTQAGGCLFGTVIFQS
jgi:hypothetical protein